MPMAWGLVLSVLTLGGWAYMGKLNFKPSVDAKARPWWIQLALQVPWWASVIMIGDWYRCPNTALFTLYFVVMLALIYRARKSGRKGMYKGLREVGAKINEDYYDGGGI